MGISGRSTGDGVYTEEEGLVCLVNKKTEEERKNRKEKGPGLFVSDQTLLLGQEKAIWGEVVLGRLIYCTVKKSSGTGVQHSARVQYLSSFVIEPSGPRSLYRLFSVWMNIERFLLRNNQSLVIAYIKGRAPGQAIPLNEYMIPITLGSKG